MTYLTVIPDRNIISKQVYKIYNESKDCVYKVYQLKRLSTKPNFIVKDKKGNEQVRVTVNPLFSHPLLFKFHMVNFDSVKVSLSISKDMKITSEFEVQQTSIKVKNEGSLHKYTFISDGRKLASVTNLNEEDESGVSTIAIHEEKFSLPILTLHLLIQNLIPFIEELPTTASIGHARL